MRKFVLPLAVFVLVCAPSYGQSPKPAEAVSALDKATLERYIRHLFVWGPHIQVTVQEPKPAAQLPGFKEVSVIASAGPASQQETFLVSADGKKIIRGRVFNIAENPFGDELTKIKTDLQPSFGTPGAPVVLVVYSDFQCGYCKEEAKLLREQVATAYPAQLRVYFKDFPLEAIHPWAKPAAIAGRCIFRQKPAAFWDYHDWIFEKQEEITAENLKEKVMEFARAKALEPVQLGGCIDSKATEAEVNRSIAEAQGLGVNSTPTIYVNGRRLVGQVGMPQLKQIIDHEIEYQKAHGGGEKCCEVKLPSPVQ